MKPSTGLFSAFQLCAGDPNANTWDGTIWLSLGGTGSGEEAFIFWYPHKVYTDEAIHVAATVDDLTLNRGRFDNSTWPHRDDLIWPHPGR